MQTFFISSFSTIGRAGFSTRHPEKIRTGCYGINGPVPYAVLDKNFYLKEPIKTAPNI
jgi:hypothetical protein